MLLLPARVDRVFYLTLSIITTTICDSNLNWMQSSLYCNGRIIYVSFVDYTRVDPEKWLQEPFSWATGEWGETRPLWLNFQWLQTDGQMFRLWPFPHLAFTSNVSNSSRCFMGSLNYVLRFFLSVLRAYLMPQLVLKWCTGWVLVWM